MKIRCSGLLVLVVAAVMVTLIAGCGGGGGGGTGAVSIPPTVQTGVLYASPVGGVSYSTPTRSGTTNALGQFEYLSGETVTFRIGNFTLGQTTGDSIVIPMALKNNVGVPVDPILSLQLLQTLDADNNPANGITVPPLSYPSGHLVELASEEAAQSFLTTANVTTNLVSATAAVEHFMSSVDTAAEQGGAPESAVAPRSYTKLRAVVATRDPVDPIMPDPACSLGDVGEVSVERATAVWSPASVTVRINQQDYLLPGPGNKFAFENDAAKVEFLQPELVAVHSFARKPRVSFLDDYDTTAWWSTGFQKYDDGMGVVRYSDKASGCDYRVLVKDTAWYAQRSNLPPRSQLAASVYRLDGCQNGTITPTDGSVSYCAGDTGDKWFTYFSGVSDPDGYVGRLDWRVDLGGADWINGSCSSGTPSEGKIDRSDGKVVWSCDDYNQVSLKVHLNWLNPLLAKGYPEHSVTITPYDNNQQKGQKSSLTVPGKEAPQSSTQCAIATYEGGFYTSDCTNDKGFIHGVGVKKSGDFVTLTTYDGGCETSETTYQYSTQEQRSVGILNSTCIPNVLSSYTYTSAHYFGDITMYSENSGENWHYEAGIVEWCASFTDQAYGVCQLVPEVQIPTDIPSSMVIQPVTPSCSGGQIAVGSSCQCPAGETLESGVCVAAPLTGTPDAKGCFLVDPDKLSINAVRGDFMLGAARVTLTNSHSHRIVAEVQFTGGGSPDVGQVSIVANSTNRWTGGESSLTGYKVEFWGSTTPANDWVCHKPEFTQVKSGSL